MFRLIPAFVSTVFLSVNFGLLLYINSTYLGSFFSAGVVSAIFLLASTINILIFLAVPKILAVFGRGKTFFLFTAVTALGAWGLAVVPAASPAGTGTALLALSFIVYEAFIFLAYYSLDIIVEEGSVDKHTGEIRGVYTTLLNAGIMAGPLLLYLFSAGENLRPLYMLALALLVIPLVYSLFFAARGNSHFGARHASSLPIRYWWKRRNIRAVTFSKLSLETFYGAMAIYTPIYLHGALGFSWAELGVIFTVMLLPFILIQWPAGELADRFWGEKEMMSVGFFLMGVALLAMPFPGKSFLLWMMLLFLSRVGAALVEIMTDTYFFKKIDAKDTGILAIFRIMRPMGLLLGALLGFVSLQFFSLEKIFFVLAFVVLLGMREALYLRDTL